MQTTKTKIIHLDGILNLFLVFIICYATFGIVKKAWKKSTNVNISLNSPGTISVSNGKSKTLIHAGSSIINLKNGHLTVNGKDYGKLPKSSSVKVDNGKVYIDGEELKPILD